MGKRRHSKVSDLMRNSTSAKKVDPKLPTDLRELYTHNGERTSDAVVHAKKRAKTNKPESYQRPNKPTLMGLPTEIRLQIFELALRKNRPIKPVYGNGPREMGLLELLDAQYPKSRKNAGDRLPRFPPILLVNRQLSSEALDVLYGKNTFIIPLQENHGKNTFIIPLQENHDSPTSDYSGTLGPAALQFTPNNLRRVRRVQFQVLGDHPETAVFSGWQWKILMDNVTRVRLLFNDYHLELVEARRDWITEAVGYLDENIKKDRVVMEYEVGCPRSIWDVCDNHEAQKLVASLVKECLRRKEGKRVYPRSMNLDDYFSYVRAALGVHW